MATVKSIAVLFLILQVITAYKLSPPKQSQITPQPKNDIEDIYRDLHETLYNLKYTCSKQMEQASNDLATIAASSENFILQSTNDLEIRLDNCEKVASELGEEAIRRFEKDSRNIYKILIGGLFEVSDFATTMSQSIETNITEVYYKIDSTMKKAEEDFYNCSGIDCMLLISNLHYTVADLSSEAAHSFAPIFENVWIITQFKLIQACDQTALGCYNILTELEKYLNIEQ